MLNSNSPIVLVVDDIETNLLILEEILKDNYRVITAPNGKKALELLNTMQEIPKLILLDLVMPEMCGRTLLGIIKEDEKLKRIPVIFITAKGDSETELLSAGAVDFISKPFMPEIVLLRVKNQIELKNYSDSLELMVAKKTAEATKTLDNALQGLANVIEHRDMESGEHVKRTQLYVEVLIEYILSTGNQYSDELLKQEPDMIIKAMALHDVGKIAIPDRILLKPGKLDPEEYEIMKTHTTQGKAIIGELGDVSGSIYLRHCQDICYGHHERWDGKGYPQGISGTNIPLSARLAALSDVYDALVCVRVYKPSMPYEKAFGIMSDGRGTQFDPVLTDIVIENQKRFIEINEKYK